MTWIDKLKPYRRKRLNKENFYLSNIIKIWKRNAKQVSTMCFARIMQIIKRIFKSSYLYVVFAFIIYISVYMILEVITDKYTPINEKNDENNNKWVLNLNYKKGETVPTKSSENLNTFLIRMPITGILLTITCVVLLLMIYYLCRKCYKTVYPTDYDIEAHDIEDPDIDNADFVRRNVPVHFQNNRVVFRLGREHSLDEERF
ncbi:uncharacterized protein LOC126859298 isoform X1 [Cataglyphis hispanica]|uniref:uncharacterized protein LOC126859298 isoform X1 n=1 Tax=Cataglyphis hispanica TaxID=1086592 RepID=UPI00217FE619|nr:uncharacterized protein LOC126859298 isoform X1 [Cataglyphis hispanica]